MSLTKISLPTATVTGNFLITLTIINSLTESQILSTGICFMLAAIILILIYRNPVLGLITMIPVSISILWILGTMYYIGYTLNVLTITVTSITIGVGVDYGIYITQRFRLVANKTGDPNQALQDSISLTGSSVLIAAISSMTGFAVLLFAPIPPQQQFGLITAVTLSYSFLISIFVLPLVLVRWANWRKKRKGYIVHRGPPKGQTPDDGPEEYTGEQ
jgi:predicted RND superfamily exporter protein